MRLRTLWLPIIFLALAGCGNEDDEIELTDKAQLFIDRTALLFNTEYGGGTYLGTITSNALYIENRGRQALEITEITKSAPGEFTVRLPQALAEGQPLLLQSRETAFVEVTFKPTQAKTYEGKLIIKSNDENAPQKEIAMTGKGVTPPPPAP